MAFDSLMAPEMSTVEVLAAAEMSTVEVLAAAEMSTVESPAGLFERSQPVVSLLAPCNTDGTFQSRALRFRVQVLLRSGYSERCANFPVLQLN